VEVVGVGSPAGDDRVGWLAVEALARSPLLDRLPAELQVAISVMDRPGAALLGRLQLADAAIVVDALAGEGRPGSIERLDLDQLATDPAILSGHAFGVGSALALGRALGMLPGRLVVLGVRVEHCAPDAPPSGQIASAVPAVVQRIVDELCGIADVG